MGGFCFLEWDIYKYGGLDRFNERRFFIILKMLEFLVNFIFLFFKKFKYICIFIVGEVNF